VVKVIVIVNRSDKITRHKEFRESLNTNANDELLIIVKDRRIVVEESHDPYNILEEILGDLSFDRKLRVMAEREAIKELME